MNARKTARLPAEIETVRRRFAEWRTGRKVPSPIPESLWGEAVDLAGSYGVSRIARILRLGYYSLQERLERETTAAAGDSEGPPAATFLELAVGSGPSGGQCLVHWEDASGAKMRIQIPSLEGADLVGLSRTFWERRR